jgi:hypothetical protein
MVAIRISPNRPRLLRAVMEARDYELDKFQFEQEEPGNEYRVDLIEFATICLMIELGGERLTNERYFEGFMVGLSAMTTKYQTPVLCRALAALAEDGAP